MGLKQGFSFSPYKPIVLVQQAIPNFEQERCDAFLMTEISTIIAYLLNKSKAPGLGESLMTGCLIADSEFGRRRVDASQIREDRPHPQQFYELLGYRDDRHCNGDLSCLCLTCQNKQIKDDPVLSMSWFGSYEFSRDDANQVFSMTNNLGRQPRSWFRHDVTVTLPKGYTCKEAFVVWRTRANKGKVRRGTDALCLVLNGLT